MYKRILVPLSLEHGLAAEALKIASALLDEGGTISALHVYETPEGSVRAYLDEDAVRAGFDEARRRLEERVAGHPNVIAVLHKGHTARTIVDYAQEARIDCIVIGSHKPGLPDYLIGSTAARVVRHAPCAVHVLRTSD